MSLLSRWRAARASRRSRGSLTIARSARIDGGVRIEVERDARLAIGPHCHLEPHVRIFVRGGAVELHEGVVLGERSTLLAVKGITLRERARLGPRAAVIDFAPCAESSEVVLRRQGFQARSVEIGADAVIEVGAVVEAGAHVQAATRVAAGTVLAGEG
jgi:acetyltransferase-like isoleucine patch superfamily enzyme